MLSNLIFSCDRCEGKGKIINSVCHHCHGTKVEKGEQFVMIFIEKGMMDGQEIVSPSDGDENPGTRKFTFLVKLCR